MVHKSPPRTLPGLWQTIEQGLQRKGYTFTGFAEQAAGKLGMGLEAVRTYLSAYHEGGYVYGTFSSSPMDLHRKIQTLARLLEMLETPAEDPVIDRLRQDYGLIYPPPAEESNGLTLEKKIRRLSPEDRGCVEILVDELLAGYSPKAN